MAEDSEFRKFMRILLDDVDAADNQLSANDNQTNRRMLVRTFFSLVEGSAFTFRQMAIEGLQLNLRIATFNADQSKRSDKDYKFHQKRYEELKDCYLELAVLNEIGLRPDNSGRLIKQPHRNSLVPTVALSLRA